MTAGGQDVWPIFVTGYGILGSAYPGPGGPRPGPLGRHDQVQRRDQPRDVGASSASWPPDMIESGRERHPGRRRSGPVRDRRGRDPVRASPGSRRPSRPRSPPSSGTFIPFPGSDDAAANKAVFGKYDQGWTIAANTPNKDASLAYLAEFSEPANYQEFVTAVGAIPTQPDATLDTKLGNAIAPLPRRLPHRLGALLDPADGRRPVRLPVRVVLQAVRRVRDGAAGGRRRPGRPPGRTRRQPVSDRSVGHASGSAPIRQSGPTLTARTPLDEDR